jgi:ketosteroid isomerase-like protein
LATDSDGVNDDARLDSRGFRSLLERVAGAWTEQDAEAAVACFADDAVYMEPPDQQLYIGGAQLRPYFEALERGTYMIWRSVWFDDASQTGAGEFSFGKEDAPHADHGVAVIELRDGRIARWREYQRPGPSSFEEFVAETGKEWAWTIDNYP